jgi:NADPH:quinone reductase-like Zn-dependent oxidoreductase
MRAVALNHIDVWGWRGMAFAKRALPLTVGAEAVGEVVALGEGVTGWRIGQRAVPYGALTCGHCRACREGRDNLCENVAGVKGFHVDGFAQELMNQDARLLVPVPDGVSINDAACAAITFSTVEHMLFDNAKLEPGETILIQAAGSGIGTVAVKMAKALGCTVIATAGSDEKCARAKALGADYVVNYTDDRFESVARKVTRKRGVDVVFEHVGATTWAGSLLSLNGLGLGSAKQKGAGRLDRGLRAQSDAAVEVNRVEVGHAFTAAGVPAKAELAYGVVPRVGDGRAKAVGSEAASVSYGVRSAPHA